MEKKKSEKVVESYHKDKSNKKIKSDVLGSYTGTPDKWEEPDQDADDL